MNQLFRQNDTREYLDRVRRSSLPPLMINVAITGSFHGKEININLPETPDEQADEARRCSDAGAIQVHVHARDPASGYAEPSRKSQDFLNANRAIRKKCPEIIINNTSGGGLGFSLEDRLCSLDANPEVSDIDMGPFSLKLKLKKREEPLKGRDADMIVDGAMGFTVGETEERARRMKERRIRPELALFHAGNWATVYNLIAKDLIESPYNFYFLPGMITGALPTASTLIDMLTHVPEPANVFVGSIGIMESHMTAIAIAMGLHVTVGMENNLVDAFGKKYDTNARGVERVVRIARELGRNIATPAEAREMLGVGAEPSSYPE